MEQSWDVLFDEFVDACGEVGVRSSEKLLTIQISKRNSKCRPNKKFAKACMGKNINLYSMVKIKNSLL